MGTEIILGITPEKNPKLAIMIVLGFALGEAIVNIAAGVIGFPFAIIYIVAMIILLLVRAVPKYALYKPIQMIRIVINIIKFIEYNKDYNSLKDIATPEMKEKVSNLSINLWSFYEEISNCKYFFNRVCNIYQVDVCRTVNTKFSPTYVKDIILGYNQLTMREHNTTIHGIDKYIRNIIDYMNVLINSAESVDEKEKNAHKLLINVFIALHYEQIKAGIEELYKMNSYALLINKKNIEKGTDPDDPFYYKIKLEYVYEPRMSELSSLLEKLNNLIEPDEKITESVLNNVETENIDKTKIQASLPEINKLLPPGQQISNFDVNKINPQKLMNLDKSIISEQPEIKELDNTISEEKENFQQAVAATKEETIAATNPEAIGGSFLNSKKRRRKTRRSKRKGSRKNKRKTSRR
jgi:hypothetical protein